MSDLIDKKVLYNRFADLEAVALEQVKKHMGDEDLTEWRIWSTILTERTAYKYDVFDAPVVDAEPVRHRRWENSRPDAPMFGYDYCSECGRKRTSPQDNYCPNCGAKMDGERREDGKT